MRSPSFRHVLAACAGIGFCAFAPAARPTGLNILHTFIASTEGDAPQSELTQGTDLRLYGTTSSDGINGNGGVFSISTGGSFLSLSSFGPISEGIKPIGGLVQASDGNFYGTTYGGGDNSQGILFQVTAAGDLTRLASFSTNLPGTNPVGTLTQGVDGFLYGTAMFGGFDNFGTLYRASVPDGAVAPISTFAAGLDGGFPESDLVQASDGYFYGTTTRGGTSDAGTIFRVSPIGVRTIIYNFTGNTDGSNPLRGVTVGRDGFLYGITNTGGAFAGGTIYRVTTEGVFTLLYTFTAVLNNPYYSFGRLVQASDGNFYGTTNMGGTFGAGTIFEISPTGVFTLLYSFTSGTDGGYPKAGLLQGADGSLYGTTSGLNGQFSTLFQADLGLAKPTPQPIVIAPATVSVGDTVAIKGENFLGATGVFFPSTAGSVPATSFVVLSKTMLQAVVPAGAVSGVVAVANGVLVASTPLGITVNTTTTPPPGGGGTGTPVVTITATDPVASESGANTGRFKLKRKGGDRTKPLTVVIKILGSATRGVDYNLSNRGQDLPTVTNSITIPSNKASTVVNVSVIDDVQVEPDERVVIKLRGGADYTLGTQRKAVVVIADND